MLWVKTALTVGEVARLAGVTVRTLHHYDKIGLVVPADRTESDYRLYGAGDIDRLQEVLFYRELGFALDEISDLLTKPDHDRPSVLTQQRALLRVKADRMMRMIGAIDAALASLEEGTAMTPEEKLEVFGDFDPTDYEKEAKERWGESDAYKQSSERTARYTKEDWAQLGEESDAINASFVRLMRAGIASDSDEAMDVAERHRAHITKWFYDCPEETHAGLGEMYIADARFTANIDKAGDGLAKYMSEAFAANSLRD